MRPKPVKLTVDTTEQTYQLGPSLREVMIKNVGPSDVTLDFDNAITTNSYLLEAGETLNVGWDFVQLHYQGSGSATLYLLKIIQ